MRAPLRTRLPPGSHAAPLQLLPNEPSRSRGSSGTTGTQAADGRLQGRPLPEMWLRAVRGSADVSPRDGHEAFQRRRQSHPELARPANGVGQVHPAVHELPRRGARSGRGNEVHRGRFGVSTRMHENRCYVKSAWIGLVGALALLALPAPSRAELVAPTQSDALLAVAPDGSPRVVFSSGRDIVVGRRTSAGWRFVKAGQVPGTRPVLAGLVVDGHGRTSVL